MGIWILAVLFVGAVVYMVYLNVLDRYGEELDTKGKVFFVLGVLAVNLALPVAFVALGLEWAGAIPPLVLFSPVAIATLLVLLSLD